MATPPPLLLLSTLLLLSAAVSATHHHPHHHNSTSSTTITNATDAATAFIRDSCRVTQYPRLCYHSLSPFSGEIHRSPRRLALTALALSLSRARSTARYVHTLKSTAVHVSHRELEAVKDCVDTMGDSVDQLSRSMGELGGQMDGGDFMFHVSNVQTWVSAALTNENTCVDGLYENENENSGGIKDGNEKIKGAIKMRVNNVAQVTSNALALVNHFAEKYEGVFEKVKPKHPKKP